MAGTTLNIDRDQLVDLIREQLSYGVYHCHRVWEAWQVGTMTVEDFSPYSESDSPEELGDAIIAKFGTEQNE